MSRPQVLAIRAARTRLQLLHADEYETLLNEEYAAMGLPRVIGTLCRACGEPTGKFLQNGRTAAHAGQCKAVWAALRLHLPEEREKHRLVVARRDIQRAADPIKVRAAQRLIEGTAGTHGRWFIEGSLAWTAAVVAYRNDWPIFKELDEQLQKQIRSQSDALTIEALP